MDVRIRPVELTDRESIRRLAPRLLVGVDPSRPGPQVEAAVRGWLDDSVTRAGSDGHAGWVAVVDGVVVGFVSVSEEDHWCGEKDAWIGELVVEQEFERHGVARRLVASAERWAVERGLGRVRLSTGAGNAGARAFYDRLGYVLNEVTLTRQLPG
ncbi:MAG TPA: GNAT family N-acetyltransferase [Nocardioides sp.]|jgi:GNAT superfamily N-acetyltransferase|uniref:GNAT family N-acetyltransferase n=1 Tax=Nocardioides sp. TaxID=35761 RepID=UPI002E334817|nr:GNAT family N-acetyltransferase [Nocardioides sp.]HEX3931973.1 GNAT family N-acetyltransferase [Nocardioides sp.]